MNAENVILPIVGVVMVLAVAIWARRASQAAARTGRNANRKIVLVVVAACVSVPLLILAYMGAKDFIHMTRTPAQVTSIESLCQVGTRKRGRRQVNSRTDTMSCTEAQAQQDEFGARADVIAISRLNYRYRSPATDQEAEGFADIRPENYPRFSAGQSISVLVPRDGSAEGKFPREE